MRESVQFRPASPFFYSTKHQVIMTHPHFIPEQVAWILQWAKDQGWDILWTITCNTNTLRLERGLYAASFSLPTEASLSEWEAILVAWQNQNNPAHNYDKAI